MPHPSPVSVFLLALLLGLAGCRPGRGDTFAVADDDEEQTPSDDDGAGDHDDPVTPYDEPPQMATDDDTATAPDQDPCGAVYQPRNGPVDGALEMAVMDSHRTGSAPDPIRIHTGFHDDAGTSLTVAWETDPDTWASLIAWGTATPTEHTRTGYSYPVGDDPEHPEVQMHEARICNLTPGETYQIRVGSHAAWSAPIQFTTFDPDAEELSLAITGDTRGGESIMIDVLDPLLDRAPQAVLHTGDFVDYGGDIAGWRAFHDAYISVIGPRLPLIPVHGNHEGHAAEYYTFVIGGGDEEWYDLDLGPLHLYVLDDSRDTATLEEEALWLDDRLSQCTSPFKLVATHRPPYSCGSHGDAVDLQEIFEPVFDAHHVDLVIAGHDHGYSRTYPLVGGVIQDQPEDGTTYVVSGGGGASLYGFTPDDRTAFADSVNHAVHIDISGGVLTMQVVVKDGVVIDELRIDRSGP